MNRGAVDLYLKKVKKELRCSAKQKRAFLAELETGLRELAQESSDLTIDQLTNAFGTPQQQAQDFMETLDAKEIKKAFTWKQVVVLGVIAALLIWLGVAIAAIIDAHIDNHGYDITVIDDSADADIIALEGDKA